MTLLPDITGRAVYLLYIEYKNIAIYSSREKAEAAAHKLPTDQYWDVEEMFVE